MDTSLSDGLWSKQQNSASSVFRVQCDGLADPHPTSLGIETLYWNREGWGMRERDIFCLFWFGVFYSLYVVAYEKWKSEKSCSLPVVNVKMLNSEDYQLAGVNLILRYICIDYLHLCTLLCRARTTQPMYQIRRGYVPWWSLEIMQV